MSRTEIERMKKDFDAGMTAGLASALLWLQSLPPRGCGCRDRVATEFEDYALGIVQEGERERFDRIMLQLAPTPTMPKDDPN